MKFVTEQEGCFRALDDGGCRYTFVAPYLLATHIKQLCKVALPSVPFLFAQQSMNFM